MSEQIAKGWQRPSIYDVAKQAGVSHMTVSRVLNGHPNIRESTRERVLQAIDEMNYTRSSIARALATRRAMRIGVLVDSPVQWGPNSTLRAIESAARDAGYAISAFSISDDEESQNDTGVVELVTQGVDALCVIAPARRPSTCCVSRAPAFPPSSSRPSPTPRCTRPRSTSALEP
nr:hypothetical protein GCM10025699_14560 [Microbacterium flavescens]